VELGDERVDDVQVEFEPWHAVWSESGTWPGQDEIRERLVDRIGATFGERSYVAPSAAILCDELVLGARSFVAAGCQLRDRVRIGDDCSLNPHVTMAGRVTLGDGVRIASHAALFGFNHNFDRLDCPIWMQGLTELGIVVEDDVWIGTHVVVCDGVTIGAHSVVAAGAVVARDVPPYSVVVGVPARVVRDRRDPADARGPTVVDGTRAGALARFATRVEEQWPDTLERCVALPGDAATRVYVDRPGAPRTTRANCDALEIAAAVGDVDRLGRREQWVGRLQDLQDAVTGLLPDPAEGIPDDPLAWRLGAEYHHYGVLSVGYALEVLGAAPRRPIGVVDAMDADELVARLDALPWGTLAWPAGAWVDFVGTALYLNRRYHGCARGPEALFGWLDTRRDRHSAMWGSADDTWGWLMPVNGFYRASRGTYAQWGVPLPNPEGVVDTVIAHGRDYSWFESRERNACNVLDVVHPLWLCGRQSSYRAAECRDQLGALLSRALDDWIDGEGFAFATGGEPGLQGTEMWLSIVYLIAHALGEADGLPWRPRGVHRPEPVISVGPVPPDR
jgi:acetyltransferase-like isoleucine patch superfamily enzyme